MHKQDDKKLMSKIIELFDKYPDAYTEEEKEYIIKNYNWISYNNGYNYILREIYDELGLIAENKNIYIGFIDLIDKVFSLERNIVEIGGGIIPRLSKRIALRQNKGNITVYDPRLATTTTKLQNLKLIKEKFDKDHSASNNLYIGLEPYGGTKTIIETACKNNSDFIIALGDLPKENNSIIDETEYDYLQQILIYEARNLVYQYGIGRLEKASLEDYGNIYPVIYNKRK